VTLKECRQITRGIERVNQNVTLDAFAFLENEYCHFAWRWVGLSLFIKGHMGRGSKIGLKVTHITQIVPNNIIIS